MFFQQPNLIKKNNILILLYPHHITQSTSAVFSGYSFLVRPNRGAWSADDRDAAADGCRLRRGGGRHDEGRSLVRARAARARRAGHPSVAGGPRDAQPTRASDHTIAPGKPRARRSWPVAASVCSLGFRRAAALRPLRAPDRRRLALSSRAVEATRSRLRSACPRALRTPLPPARAIVPTYAIPTHILPQAAAQQSSSYTTGFYSCTAPSLWATMRRVHRKASLPHLPQPQPQPQPQPRPPLPPLLQRRCRGWCAVP